MKLSVLALAAGAMLATSSALPANADEAAFGCKVLLCAASKNPSWKGVAYCVPPMVKLISIRKTNPGYWPICPGSGVGKPQRENFEDCPAGFTPYAPPTGREGRASSEKSACIKPAAKNCRSTDRFHVASRDRSSGDKRSFGSSCEPQIIARARRTDNYFLTIKDGDGVPQRHYFSLKK